MTERKFEPNPEIPEEYREDLTPHNMAGMNYGLAGPNPARDAPTALDIKEAHERLEGFTDDELRQIPILPEGSRLAQGATYIDLCNSEATEFTARGGMEAGDGNWYVPKSEVDYQLWNRLIGVTNPERLAEDAPGAARDE